MKRWIIRSFFIGLLLLCVGGWVVSYFLDINMGCVELKGGKINLMLHSGYPMMVLFSCMFWMFLRFLGFGLEMSESGPLIISVPFWLPTTWSAALFWLVWRKTRMPVKGRAFPVELAKPSEKP